MQDPVAGVVDVDAALKPFLQAAQESASSNVSTIRSVVLKVLSDPDVFAGYDQLKAIWMPALCGGSGKDATAVSPDADKILQTLDLFSYGTYANYVSASSRFLPLVEAHLFKLRQLTVLSLVQTACHNKQDRVRYQEVQEALQLSSTNPKDATTTTTAAAAVEEVLMSCLYARVMQGQLCQKTQTLCITGLQGGPPCRPRDVPLGVGVGSTSTTTTSGIPDMLAALDELQRRLVQAHLNLDEQQNHVMKQIENHHAFLVQAEGQKQKALADAAAASAAAQQSPLDFGSGFGDFGGGGRGAGGGGGGSRRQKRSRGGLTSNFTGNRPFAM